MGKGRRKLVRRKNYELSLKVRVPLELLKPFTVSLPLMSYVNAPLVSGEPLSKRLLATKQLPPGWSVASESSRCTTLYKVKCTSPEQVAFVNFSFVIHDDLTWTLTMGSIPVLPTRLPEYPAKLLYVQQIVSLLLTFDGCKLCIGNPDEKYMCLVEKHKGNLRDQTGKQKYYCTIINSITLLKHTF